MKKVSIIIPLYKSETHIKNILDNMLQQTYTAIEVVLVNDGSPDKTGDVVESEMMNRDDHRIYYYEKSNGGIASAKNFGLTKTTGEYIMFCDHDDWLENNAIETLVLALERSNSDIAVGKYVRDFKYKKSFIERCFPFEVKLDFFPKEGGKLIDHKGMLVEIYQALWGKLYKKELFDNFYFNPELNGMDDLGSTSILLGKANRIVGVDSVLYHYAYYKTSTIQSATSTFENKKIYDAYYDVERWYKENKRYDDFQEEFEYLYFYHCVLSYGVRTLQRSTHYKEEIEGMKRELVLKYPHFKHNKYYKNANLGMKLFLPLTKSKLILTLLNKLLK